MATVLPNGIHGLPHHMDAQSDLNQESFETRLTLEAVCQVTSVTVMIILTIWCLLQYHCAWGECLWISAIKMYFSMKFPCWFLGELYFGVQGQHISSWLLCPEATEIEPPDQLQFPEGKEDRPVDRRKLLNCLSVHREISKQALTVS